VKKLAFMVALCAAISVTASVADAAPSAMARACAKDIRKVCADVKPGGGALKACVKEHFADLSPDCQIAIVKVAAVGRACKADVKEFCSSVRPGKSRVAECVQAHLSEVSTGCKEALAKAEAGSK
jgi:hypothetical protein